MSTITPGNSILNTVANTTEPLIVDIATAKLTALNASLPPELAPFVAEYGPTLVQWSADKLKAFVLQLSGPDATAVAAYKALLAEMDVTGILGELAKLHASFLEANAANAAKIAADKAELSNMINALIKIGIVALSVA